MAQRLHRIVRLCFWPSGVRELNSVDHYYYVKRRSELGESRVCIITAVLAWVVAFLLIYFAVINLNHARRMNKIDIKNFLFTLGGGRLFKFADQKYTGSKYTMPQVLVDDVPDLDRIDSIYLQRNLDLVLRQFPGISMGRVVDLMGE